MNDKNKIERTYYIDRIMASLGTPVIKVITGMRRVGKSSIMLSILSRMIMRGDMRGENIFSMNKEYPEFFHIRTGEDLMNLLDPFLSGQTGRFVIAIDEVQEIDGWERILSGILAQYGNRCDIIITGSNSHLLSSELATLIAGRYITFQIFPLSWLEYREFTGYDNTREAFIAYMQSGGLPGIHAFGDNTELRMSYLRSVYESIVLRDIVERFQIRGFDFLRNLYHYTCANIGHVVSAQSIARYLRNQKITVSVDSIIQYLSYGTHTYIFEKVGSVEPNTKKYFEIYNKYYAGDVGLRNSIVGYIPSRDMGDILENIVFLLLRTYGFEVQIGRIGGELEIDFIAKKGEKKIYFQVALSIMDDTTRAREYASLEMIKDNFEKYVVHFDNMDWGVTEHGIKHISALELEDRLRNESF